MDINFDRDAYFLDRAKQLAELGGRKVSPNPKVGAVIVSNGIIIGEGYHQELGKPHAEINALTSVRPDNQPFVKGATLYVTLEPCSHFGRTPPCSLALIKAGIKRVVISATDPSEKVNGKGIEILKNARIKVDLRSSNLTKILPHHAFSILTLKKRPEIILKFAQSSDYLMGIKKEQVWLTNSWSKRLVHLWRSKTGAIIAGTNTFLSDDPMLTTRYGFGENPLRIIPDFNHKVTAKAKVFSDPSPIWIIVDRLPVTLINLPHVTYQIIPSKADLLQHLNRLLSDSGISTLLVEGGQKLLNSYLDSGLWDEARVFEVVKKLGNGIAAPRMNAALKCCSYTLMSDRLTIYRNEN